MNIEFTIDRYEGDIAVLKAQDGTSVNWPKAKLPSNTKEGTVIFFTILDNNNGTEDKKELAKNILNEILNTEENS